MTLRSLLLAAAALVATVSAASAQAVIPDATLTPGSVRTTDAGEVCSQGTRQFRHPHDAMAIMAEYGLPPDTRANYEIDHLIPLELGGADDDANLWPEPLSSADGWSAGRKDELEDRLHFLVCSGQLDLREAQKAIAEDWTAAYARFVGAE